MHDESKAGEVVVQFIGCLVEFLSGLEAEEAIVYIEVGAEVKG
jgi:hypothetical protein